MQNIPSFPYEQPADSTISPEKFLVEQARLRAENLFKSQAMLCAEAVIYTLNEAFEGPLTPEEAICLGSPFCVGMGGAGCACGALTGAIAAVGLFAGKKRIGENGAPIRNCAHQIHDSFRNEFGATCCRVLTKKVKNDKKAHFAQCTKLTGYATALAATHIIAQNTCTPNMLFLQKRNSKLGTWIYRLRAFFS